MQYIVDFRITHIRASRWAGMVVDCRAAGAPFLRRRESKAELPNLLLWPLHRFAPLIALFAFLNVNRTGSRGRAPCRPYPRETELCGRDHQPASIPSSSSWPLLDDARLSWRWGGTVSVLVVCYLALVAGAFDLDHSSRFLCHG